MNFNILDLKVPYTDLKVNVNSVCKQMWQAQWNACRDNKLFQINPTVGDFYVWTGLSHREEIVITRARIGHTYFTHSYLLKGEEMSWCIPRHCPDTVKHILLDCINLCDTRIKYYRDINAVEKLFNENASNIINHLKECGLFKKINTFCFLCCLFVVFFYSSLYFSLSYNVVFLGLFWPPINCLLLFVYILLLIIVNIS